MSKYIRAVVAAKAIADKYGIPLGDLVDTFADIPTADVVPVVHCKYCKYKASDTECDTGVIWCNKLETHVPDMGFCSYGERL